jgi:hypothetical protein
MAGQARIAMPEMPYLYRVVRYVENKPVRTKIVKKVWEYR